MIAVEVWADARRRDPALRLMKQRALRHLTAGLPRGALVCDLGCGTGEDAAELAHRGFELIGIDPDPRMIALASDRFGRRRVEFRRGSFASPPGDLRGRCSAILAFHVANAAPGPVVFARACASLLRPGGRAVFTTVVPTGWQLAWRIPAQVIHANVHPGETRIRYAGRTARLLTPGLGAVLRLFRDEFDIKRVEPLGLLLPGAGAMPGAGRRLPASVLRFLDRMESRCTLPPLVRLADHALVIVRKR